MTIPIRNVYYLLCYAWNAIEAQSLIDVGAVPGNRVENLLGKVLQDGVAHLIRRGLDRGYVTEQQEARRVRGKLLLSETVGRMLLPRGRAVCRVDELSHDVPHNRVIKAAMRELCTVPGLDRSIHTALRDHCRRLEGVSDIDLSPSAFRSIQLHRNVSRYAFLVQVAELVSRCFMPDEKTGRRRFYPFTANEQDMGALFEAFVRNFLRREQSFFQVSAAKVSWNVDLAASSPPSWLPEMRTDVMLTHPAHRVIIDAKFYASPYQSYHGSKKLRSSHLYQVLTYLGQLRATAGPEPVGVLLYAATEDAPRFDYRLSGHRILVRSVALAREWQDIHVELQTLVTELRHLDSGESIATHA